MEVLGVRQSLPVHPLCVRCYAQKWEQCAWQWVESSHQPTLSQVGANTPGWNGVGCLLPRLTTNSEIGSLLPGP